MRDVLVNPTYGKPVAEVRIQPPLTDGEVTLLRLKAAEYGKALLMAESSSDATTCQIDDRRGMSIIPFLKYVFDPFDDGLANVHWAGEPANEV